MPLNQSELAANHQEVKFIIEALNSLNILDSQSIKIITEQLEEYAAHNLITLINVQDNELDALVNILQTAIAEQHTKAALAHKLDRWKATLRVAVEGEDSELQRILDAEPSGIVHEWQTTSIKPLKAWLTDLDINSYLKPYLSFPRDIQSDKDIYIFSAISISEDYQTLEDLLKEAKLAIHTNNVIHPVTLLVPINSDQSHWRYVKFIVDKGEIASAQIVDSLPENKDSLSMSRAVKNIQAAIAQVNEKAFTNVTVHYSEVQKNNNYLCGDLVLQGILKEARIIDPLVSADLGNIRQIVIDTLLETPTTTAELSKQDNRLVDLLQFIPEDRTDLKALLNSLTESSVQMLAMIPADETKNYADALLEQDISLADFTEFLDPLITDKAQLGEIANKIWRNNKTYYLKNYAQTANAPAWATYFDSLFYELNWVQEKWQFNRRDQELYDFTEGFATENEFDICQAMIDGDMENDEVLQFIETIKIGESKKNNNAELWLNLLGETRRLCLSHVLQKIGGYNDLVNLLTDPSTLLLVTQKLGQLSHAELMQEFAFIQQKEVLDQIALNNILVKYNFNEALAQKIKDKNLAWHKDQLIYLKEKAESNGAEIWAKFFTDQITDLKNCPRWFKLDSEEMVKSYEALLLGDSPVITRWLVESVQAISQNKDILYPLVGEARRLYLIRKIEVHGRHYAPLLNILKDKAHVYAIAENLAKLSVANFDKVRDLGSFIYQVDISKILNVCNIDLPAKVIDIAPLLQRLQARGKAGIADLISQIDFASMPVCLVPTPEELEQFADELVECDATNLLNTNYRLNVMTILARLGFASANIIKLANKIVDTNSLLYLIQLAKEKGAIGTHEILLQIYSAGKTFDSLRAEFIRKYICAEATEINYPALSYLITAYGVDKEALNRMCGEWYRLKLIRMLAEKPDYKAIVAKLADIRNIASINTNLIKFILAKKEDVFNALLTDAIEANNLTALDDLVTSWSKVPWIPASAPVDNLALPAIDKSYIDSAKNINDKLVGLADIILKGKKLNLAHFIDLFKSALSGEGEASRYYEVSAGELTAVEINIFKSCSDLLAKVHDYCKESGRSTDAYLATKYAQLDVCSRFLNPVVQAYLFKENLRVTPGELITANISAITAINNLKFTTEAELALLLRQAGIIEMSNNSIGYIFGILQKQLSLNGLKSIVLKQLFFANPKISLSRSAVVALNAALDNPTIDFDHCNQFLRKNEIPKLTRSEFNSVKFELMSRELDIEQVAFVAQSNNAAGALQELSTAFKGYQKAYGQKYLPLQRLRIKQDGLQLEVLENIASNLQDYIAQLLTHKQRLDNLNQLAKAARGVNPKKVPEIIAPARNYILNSNKQLREQKKMVTQITIAITNYINFLVSKSSQAFIFAEKVDEDISAFLSSSTLHSTKNLADLQKKAAYVNQSLGELRSILAKQDGFIGGAKELGINGRSLTKLQEINTQTIKWSERFATQVELLQRIKIISKENPPPMQSLPVLTYKEAPSFALQPPKEATKDFVRQIETEKYAVKTINSERLAKPEVIVTDAAHQQKIVYKPDDAHGLKYELDRASGVMSYGGSPRDVYVDQKRICEDMAARFVATGQKKAYLAYSKKLTEKVAICLFALNELLNRNMEVHIEGKLFKPSLIQRHKIADKKDFYLKNGYIEADQLLIYGEKMKLSPE